MQRKGNQKNEECFLTAAEFLAVLYRHQQGSFFPYEIMVRVMEELSLPPEDAAALLNECLAEGWLVGRGFKPARFLVPERVGRFPVVLSASALVFLRGDA